MGTVGTFRSDLYALRNVVQNSMITHPKEIFIESLRKFFSKDSYYHYVRDEWGFPKTPDQTGLDLDAGVDDDVTTRIFIGEYFRQGIIYYPSLLIRGAGTKSVPISFNNELGSVQWTNVRYVDGYGNEAIVATPSSFIKAGAWEGTINIDVEAKSPRARDELAELVSYHFFEDQRIPLQIAGVHIKAVNTSAPSEIDDRNDKLFKITVSCDIRSEWRREIPIENIIDAVIMSLDFGNLSVSPPVLAPNLTISTSVELVSAIIDGE